MTPRACPACASSRELSFHEEVRDPAAGGAFRLYRCGACGLAFADPREPAGADWYEKAAALEPPPAPRAAPPEGAKSLALGWRDLAAAVALPLKEYDAAVLDGALEHAPEPREFLGAVKRALKRGGRLTAVVPNDARPSFLGREPGDAPPRRVTRWTERSLRAFLDAEGFRVVSVSAPGPSARWFAERIFDGRILPLAESAAVRVLFGPDARGDLRSLYAAGAAARSAAPPDGLKGFFADPRRRASWTAVLRAACAPVVWPSAAVLSLVFAAGRGRGERLVADAVLGS